MNFDVLLKIARYKWIAANILRTHHVGRKELLQRAYITTPMDSDIRLVAEVLCSE